ncbi:nucleoside hydrolase [Agrococcus sp. HG114]|uniref:nucleoside hydrolase n=1 Tax=Agrococcus sp. HG114 TaxID=2969757 RepID=UPI00215AAE3E|nr:nucleoside hydrolase [Agrococcus sp. HG114]MCR8669775.1 nucleoside hydrolase [Agrococcus sp. HG114]
MKILIDTDPGVDDAIALLLALQHPSLEVVGLTTIGGNVGIEHTTRNALAVLELTGRSDVPVVRGADTPLHHAAGRSSTAHGSDGLGGVTLPEATTPVREGEAAAFIVETINAHPGEITLVPIGPLTNIARALELDPTIVDKVAGVMLMGGAEGTGNITPSAEFNFWHDPHAARIVMAAGFPNVTMVGLDATGRAFMSPGVRELLYQIDHPQARLIYDMTRSYADFYWRRRRVVGAELCDVLAVAMLIDPTLVETVPAHIEVCDEGLCEGRSVVARTSRYRDRRPNAAVATDNVETRRFMQLLLTTLFPTETEDITAVLDVEYRP